MQFGRHINDGKLKGAATTMLSTLFSVSQFKSAKAIQLKIASKKHKRKADEMGQ